MPTHALASHLDLLRKKNFSIPRQQRNVAHLTEVHADGIARRQGRCFRPEQRSGRPLSLSLLHFLFYRLWLKPNIRVFNEVQTCFVQRHDQAVDHRRVATLIRKPPMSLLDSYESTFPAPVNDRLQSGIQTIHAIPLSCSEAAQVSPGTELRPEYCRPTQSPPKTEQHRDPAVSIFLTSVRASV